MPHGKGGILVPMQCLGGAGATCRGWAGTVLLWGHGETARGWWRWPELLDWVVVAQPAVSFSSGEG